MSDIKIILGDTDLQEVIGDIEILRSLLAVDRNDDARTLHKQLGGVMGEIEKIDKLRNDCDEIFMESGKDNANTQGAIYYDHFYPGFREKIDAISKQLIEGDLMIELEIPELVRLDDECGYRVS